MIRKFGGAAGIDGQPQGIDIGVGGSNIKSIQRGLLNVSAAISDITISNVDLSKSIVIVKAACTSFGSTAAYECVAQGFLTSGTNVRIKLGDHYSYNTVEVAWQVIEFNNVKSLQTGFATGGTTSISAVNMSKSVVFSSEKITESGSGYDLARYFMNAVRLVTSTLLAFDRNGNATTLEIYWQVIEFN